MIKVYEQHGNYYIDIGNNFFLYRGHNNQWNKVYEEWNIFSDENLINYNPTPKAMRLMIKVLFKEVER